MPIKSVRCHVLQASVAVVADLEGGISRVICPNYNERTGVCRVKRNATRGGPLSQFLERVSEGTLDTHTTRCDLHGSAVGR